MLLYHFSILFSTLLFSSMAFESWVVNRDVDVAHSHWNVAHSLREAVSRARLLTSNPHAPHNQIHERKNQHIYAPLKSQFFLRSLPNNENFLMVFTHANFSHRIARNIPASLFKFTQTHRRISSEKWFQFVFCFSLTLSFFPHSVLFYRWMVSFCTYFFLCRFVLVGRATEEINIVSTRLHQLLTWVSAIAGETRAVEARTRLDKSASCKN